MNPSTLRDQACSIWQAGVDAVLPKTLLPSAVANHRALTDAIAKAQRVLVVGAGKAGAAMSAALEEALGLHLPKAEGMVNVPADSVRPLQRIQLHAARPAGSNHPTAAGVAGAERMLDLVAHAGPDDVALCLISGGGSALLPAPAESVTLADKQAVTKLLHACGATIHEMNAVRKHLSRIKGGRLAQAFTGRELFSLIISDVVGDPLDVIASGPTAADPSTFADALSILDRFGLTPRTPPAIIDHLRAGAAGRVSETLKQLPANVHNLVLGNNRLALDAAKRRALALGYQVLDLGSFIEGETSQTALVVAGIVRSIRAHGQPLASPACILLGGETTVTLGAHSGKGGRNQEFVLALLHKLGADGLKNLAALSGGTDGEDGPTDAAGAVIDEAGAARFAGNEEGGSLDLALREHNAYPLLDACGCLVRTGLTETNVMDLRVILVA
jgi:glycerate 2-kinase